MEGEFNTENFKVQLNNFMLMHAPEFMTIGEAENAMLALISEVEKVLLERANARCAGMAG